ncbi:peritrophin-55 [Drosophila miranda]|uniref:peritrophin-55 n=1 Tax=Drosophila miranda TaxID=7229 RepID=UPI00143F8A26|nr:peritrophin-55 [Drosophila miranda]
MKTVIFVLAAIVAVNAQNTCSRTPVYTEKIDPVVCPKAGIKLPNYANASTFYQCGSVGTNGTLTSCATENYFSYVMQTCGPCDSYLPSTICSALPFNATCVPIESATTAAPATTASTATTATTATGSTATTTTVAPSVSTASTAAPTSNDTTAAPTTEAPSTTSAVPESPTEASDSTTAGGSADEAPSGTTIFIPQPPSPGESDVPTPVTPVPTAPNIEVTPPTVQSAPA